ncbi:ABC transporter ATP-binding protein [Candidatus Woesearchaeota archaeon]|nr:ABC transporter ATP-binding protein [Candidatus Woesearchaeota archaeon]
MKFKKRLLSLFKKRSSPLVRTNNIQFSYGEKQVLAGINLTLKTSQIVAVVGRSGEGKSTFLHLLAGVVTKKFKGKIRFAGLKRGLAKKDMGFVPQEIAVVPDLSIAENLVFFGRLHGLSKKIALQRGEELLQTLQLDVALDRFPNELSGGQKVRLNIAVSLLHNPLVMILDEPFVGLDYQNRKLLWHFLELQKRKRKTIILTTHMLVEAEHHTDLIILLHKGKIFSKGKLADIRHKLNTHFILELKFGPLSKEKQKNILAYCVQHDIAIMDSFGTYMMFSVTSAGQRNYFIKFIQKLNIDCYELGFREPNLDELFLKVKSV